MNNIVEFEITATTEAALKKLSKANIPVYKLKKRRSKLAFGVSQEYVEKVFAIFKHPCYNTVIRRQSPKKRAFAFLKKRFALIIGGVLFTFACAFSGNIVMRVKVTGNGGYLAPQVLTIAKECGVRTYTACKGFDAPLLQSKVMALPSVNFCSVRRAGAYIIIDVRTEDEHTAVADARALISDVSGEVLKIVAVCGTAEKAAGDKVSAGDTLIGAYEKDAEGGSVKSLAVGFAEICVTSALSLFYESESGENAQNALKATALYSDRVTSSSYTVSPCEGGVKYEVSFTYIHTVAINMQ